MKNKDYVSQAKRKPTKRPSHKVEKKPFPLLRFVIVGLLIGAFGYGLMFLQNGSKNIEQIKDTPSKIKTKKEKTLPPPPDTEEWQFIEELKNKEVEVGTQELEDKGPFVLRCTTVRSQERAEALKAKIAFSGYESTVKEHQGTSGVWYRVDLGPFDRKREAEKIRHVMKRNNINGCKILLWR